MNNKGHILAQANKIEEKNMQYSELGHQVISKYPAVRDTIYFDTQDDIFLLA